MSKKRDRPEPRERRSPSATVADLTDGFIADMNMPQLPDSIPQRLEDALRARVEALLFQLREARRERYVKALEVRLVREAYQAVLAAYELRIADAQVMYAMFRRLIEDLGYAPADVGFVKTSADTPASNPREDL